MARASLSVLLVGMGISIGIAALAIAQRWPLVDVLFAYLLEVAVAVVVSAGALIAQRRPGAVLAGIGVLVFMGAGVGVAAGAALALAFFLAVFGDLDVRALVLRLALVLFAIVASYAVQAYLRARSGQPRQPPLGFRAATRDPGDRLTLLGIAVGLAAVPAFFLWDAHILVVGIVAAKTVGDLALHARNFRRDLALDIAAEDARLDAR